MRILLAGLVLGMACVAHAEVNPDDPQPSVGIGATVYKARCALCHGNEGFGDGPLAVAVKDYPNASLAEPRHGKDAKSLEQAVVYGGSKGAMSPLMPPWGAELTWTDIQSVVMFIDYYRKNQDGAIALLKIKSADLPPSRGLGRSIYISRCAQCHGTEGEGNGRMARMIKTPPPYNLRWSRAPDGYLEQMIAKGGGAMGRSPQMPPWGEELTGNDIKSVILYIKEFRRDP
jgi:cytochrome c oxidase cbb3-type subunit 3